MHSSTTFRTNLVKMIMYIVCLCGGAIECKLNLIIVNRSTRTYSWIKTKALPFCSKLSTIKLLPEWSKLI